MDTRRLEGQEPHSALVKFYRWYFAKDSECYIMRYDVGETMFRRADIRTFTVHTREVKESA